MSKRLRLLLVEDVMGDAALLRAELVQTRLMFELEHVQRLGQALERLQQKSYDAVLLDLSLPDSQGLDTLLRVRAQDSHVPVVILSGYEDAQIGVEAVKRGAQDYLIKGRTDSFLLERALQYAIERGAAMLALAESRQRYQRLFDTTLDAIVAHDQDGVILDINRSGEVMFGYSHESLVGQSIEMCLSWDREAGSGLGERPQFYQGTARRWDGEVFPVEVGSALMELDGRVVSLTTVRDIRERLRAEQHALDLTLERERVSILREFLHSASHDLRTPVTTLLTGIYLIQRSLVDVSDWVSGQTMVAATQIKDRLGLIIQRTERFNDEVVRLQRIVDDLLDMERLERMNFSMAQADLSFLARGAVEHFRVAAAERRVALTFDLVQDRLMVAADSVELGRAVHALVDNAIRYTPAGGYVLVTTRVEQGWAVLEVRDTGSGIDPQHLPHIFDRFYRGDPARSTQAGMGLGLAKVKVIVEAHRGRVNVTSRLGEGSIFRILLPIYASANEGGG